MKLLYVDTLLHITLPCGVISLNQTPRAPVIIIELARNFNLLTCNLITESRKSHPALLILWVIMTGILSTFKSIIVSNCIGLCKFTWKVHVWSEEDAEDAKMFGSQLPGKMLNEYMNCGYKSAKCFFNHFLIEIILLWVYIYIYICKVKNLEPHQQKDN